MAFTEEQIAILKAKIRSLYEDIGNLTMAKQQVYPLDDLDDMDEINDDQYNELNTEIEYWESQYKYIAGRCMLVNESVTSTDIENAAEGSGLMFPTENFYMYSERSTGESYDGSHLVDTESIFQWTNKWGTIDLIKPGDIIMISGTGYAITSVDDEHTLAVSVPTGTGITYTILRSLIGSPYTLLRPCLLNGSYGGTGFNTDAELNLMKSSSSYKDTGATDALFYNFVDNTNYFTIDDVGKTLHIRTGSDAGYYEIDTYVDEHTVRLDTLMNNTDTGLEYYVGGKESELEVLEWFIYYWVNYANFIPPAGPLRNLFVENVNKLNNFLDDERSAISTNKTAYYLYTGDNEDSGAGAVMLAAIANIDTTKSTLDYDGSGTIDIQDFIDAETAGDESVITDAIDARKDFIDNTRSDAVDNRVEYIETVLGEILDESSGALDLTDEQFIGSPTGEPMLYYKRFNYLDMRVNRADGTYKGIKDRGTDTVNIENMIAAKERQIEEYEALL